MWIAARGCDRIWVSPAGGVESVGIAAEMVYGNRLLTEKLGIDVDFLQIGKFKGAEEPFTRNGPSPEAKASLEGVLGGHSRGQWLAGVAEGRGQEVRDAIEDGPFSADEAKRRGLVDAVGYLDEARDDVKKLSGLWRVTSASTCVSASPRTAAEKPDFGELIRVVAGGGAEPRWRAARRARSRGRGHQHGERRDRLRTDARASASARSAAPSAR